MGRIRKCAFSILFLLVATLGFSLPQAQPAMIFTVSMEQPGNHLFHVVFQCRGLKGETQEFKMPVWSPGYYGIRDFAKNVQNFHAQNESGAELKWEHSANSWKVQTADSTNVRLTYDVAATSAFVADPYLGEDRGYIVGTGVFMYAKGHIADPVTVDIKPGPNWKDVASGLETAAPDKPATLVAPDFDVLYDSPILIGNLESLPPFTINGVPHYFTGFKLGAGNFKAAQFMDKLKSVVEQGIAVAGDIPYSHYTFLGIGGGAGGIEHLNSTTVPFTGSPALETHDGAMRTLNFLAHEYFHNFNVKRIRPVALGPFDYDNANLTNMLWVSEGFTSYYEYIMVARAGLMTREELLDSYRREIATYENSTGRLFQSATQASYDTWTQGPFGRGRGGIVKSISYYNKGAALGLLLDFKIRHETKNRKSLDTVMQTLYQKYYRQLKRGWTDAEFRSVCENTAGASLKEIFDYASTTREVDYNKYLGYAGLELEKPAEAAETFLGAIVEDAGGVPVISALEPGSPARVAGLAVKDAIRLLDGAKVDNAATLNKAVAAKKPGDKIALVVVRNGKEKKVEIVLGHRMQRTFKIIPIARPDALQMAILQDWIKPRPLPSGAK